MTKTIEQIRQNLIQKDSEKAPYAYERQFGYYGHENRTEYQDKAIMELVGNKLTDSQLDFILNSRAARHSMDQNPKTIIFLLNTINDILGQVITSDDLSIKDRIAIVNARDDLDKKFHKDCVESMLRKR